MATLTQHSSRVHKKNPSSSNNKNNPKKTGPLKVENLKDKYDYVSDKSIDSEEEFLVNFDQDAVQGINFDKNFSEYEQGESSIGHGGTGTFSNIMASLTLFNEAPKCKDIAPLAL